MKSKISVERQFRFRCSCGEMIVTGEKKVTCTACNQTMVVHRVRRRRQRHRDSVSYYGNSIPVHRAVSPGQEPSPPAATPGSAVGRKWAIPVHRVEKRRDKSKIEAAMPLVKRILAYCGKALKVRRAEKQTQPANYGIGEEGQQAGIDLRKETLGQPVIESPTRPRLPGTHVKVGSSRPDGKPHPHAGETGRITRLIDGYVQGRLQPVSAAVKLDRGIPTNEFIWVSIECLEVLPESRTAVS